jgi:hypothetical protein
MAYNIVMAAILLFPWMIVALMAVGKLVEQRKIRVRVRD